MKPIRFFLILLVGVALTCSGCAWFGQGKEEKRADELIKEGVKAFDKGSYKKALEAFEQLKDWYPFSNYAILAELKIADAHYHLQEYPEAVAAYEEFERLHPRNEATPYVVYQVGLCYFEQVDTVDRDQTPARKALETFRRVIGQYPNDPYAIKAQNHIPHCIQSMAGHEFYVGRYYYGQGFYKAALERFRSIIAEYPDVGYHRQALLYIAACEAYQPVDLSNP
jgi:outer membrane protein assembly factor BamD